MKRVLMAGIGVSTALVATAYAMAFFPTLPEVLAPALLAAGTAGMLAFVMALAAARDGRLGVLWVPTLFVILVVGGGLIALVFMPSVDAADPTLFGGLPPRAALLLYGVGFLPTLVVPVAYALTFERLTLSDDDLERVRAAARLRDNAAGGESSP